MLLFRACERARKKEFELRLTKPRRMLGGRSDSEDSAGSTRASTKDASPTNELDDAGQIRSLAKLVAEALKEELVSLYKVHEEDRLASLEQRMNHLEKLQNAEAQQSSLEQISVLEEQVDIVKDAETPRRSSYATPCFFLSPALSQRPTDYPGSPDPSSSAGRSDQSPTSEEPWLEECSRNFPERSTNNPWTDTQKAVEKSEVAFVFRPSVGTWLTLAPSKIGPSQAPEEALSSLEDSREAAEDECSLGSGLDLARLEVELEQSRQDLQNANMHLETEQMRNQELEDKAELQRRFITDLQDQLHGSHQDLQLAEAQLERLQLQNQAMEEELSSLRKALNEAEHKGEEDVARLKNLPQDLHCANMPLEVEQQRSQVASKPEVAFALCPSVGTWLAAAPRKMSQSQVLAIYQGSGSDAESSGLLLLAKAKQEMTEPQLVAAREFKGQAEISSEQKVDRAKASKLASKLILGGKKPKDPAIMKIDCILGSCEFQDLPTRKRVWKGLLLQWHPDKNHEEVAPKVFRYLKSLEKRFVG